MNNVVCYVCGTKYSEEEALCPLCGYAQTEMSPASAESNGTYTYVKGGRFSPENVQRRNGGSQAPAAKPAVKTKTVPVKAAAKPVAKPVAKPDAQPVNVDSKEKANPASIIIAVILFLAIIAVLAYIALRFFIPNNAFYEGFGGMGTPQSSQEMIDDTEAETDDLIEVSLDCTEVKLNATNVELNDMINCIQLSAILTPANTYDAVSYYSSDDTIAMVDETGLVTAVGKGTAVITAVCGDVSADCTVVCDIEEVQEELTLNRKEITFDTEGQSWLLYDGTIPMDEILWSSEDEMIATIAEGRVIAVANGDTTVYATLGEQTVACVIHCKFDGAEGETGSVTEAAGSASRTYKLYNPYGYSDDVLIAAGEKFTLKLVDENLEEAADAQWNVKNQNVCTFADNIVTGVSSGMTEVTATYEGITYTCIVRVK